jgi:hypothetical protein
MAENYQSLSANSDFEVQVRAATVYAAHEASMFLGGQTIPVVNAPNGLVKIPVLSGGAARTLGVAGFTDGSTGTDYEDVNVDQITTSGSVDIVCDLIASRTVVRDLGAIDATEIGRQLGNKVAAQFDSNVGDLLATLTNYAEASATTLTIEDIYGAIGAIRATGEMGALFGFVSADKYGTMMSEIGSTAFAGGDWQGAALQSGSLGSIAGCNFFVTSHLTNGVAILGGDAMRIAMQKNVDVEVARRAEAVGQDVVASLHAKAAIVDTTRGRFINLAS